MMLSIYFGLAMSLATSNLPPILPPDWIWENNDVRASVASGGVVTILSGGDNAMPSQGQWVYVDFAVYDAVGELVATTDGSRFPYHFQLGQDPLWDALTLGMRRQEVRKAWLTESSILALDGDFAGGPGLYSIRYRLVRIEP